MTDDELFEQALELYLEYRPAAVEVQLEIHDGDWVLYNYGDAPRECDSDGFNFRYGRTTPEGWRIDGSPEEAADRLAAWLHEKGWSNIKNRTYSDGIDNVIVEAEKPDSRVEFLMVEFGSGAVQDSATITVESTCEPGDYYAALKMNYPDAPVELEERPIAEHPLAEPSFGFTQDGQRRFSPFDR